MSRVQKRPVTARPLSRPDALDRAQDRAMCPCGCGGAVKVGNRYATRKCAYRGKHRGTNPMTIRTRAPALATAGRGEGSWWTAPALLADRVAWMAKAAQRFPSVTPPISLSLAMSPNGRLDL